MNTKTNNTVIPQLVALATGLNKTDWLSEYRQTHIDALQQSVFPHAGVEHFKYNRMDAFLDKQFNLAENATNEQFAINLLKNDSLLSTQVREQVVFVDGVFSESLSALGNHQIVTFNKANSTQQAKIVDMLSSHRVENNPFIVANACFTGVNNNAILIEANQSSPNSIIEIIHINSSRKNDTIVNSQVLIDIADGCKASVVNRCLSENDDDSRCNVLSTQHNIINIGKNASCTYYDLTLPNNNALHFASTCYNLQSNCQLDSFNTATGSTLNKVDIEVNHLGEHAQANIDGLYVANNQQQVDYHTTVNHPLPNGKTNENFRGLVNGNAEATFNGRIHISPDAQKTLAELSNKNLLLSDDAILHTKPELEIYADDVVCAHGATVSRLNNRSLNYLRARGIAKQEAEMMLSYAFFDELLEELVHQEIAEYLRPILFKRFG
ncbi:Fe-S cluster assembly protein SufD [Psychrobacter sp. HD31]|uniref:Fe-S cluster assembly protein SufD n=1 Tax=Psychrobacter sp. HD31 TaxID=3112003 RepID=UPI003DA1FB2B